MTNPTRRGFMALLGATAATAAFAPAAIAQVRSDLIAGLENEFGTNIAITIKPQYQVIVDRIAERHPELIHEIFRDGMRRTQRSPDRAGPNNSGFERDVAREIERYRFTGAVAASLGIAENTRFGALLDNVQVWENQPGRLPIPTANTVINAHIKVASEGSRAGLEYARGYVSTYRGECYSGVPLANSQPTTIRGVSLCPGGQ